MAVCIGNGNGTATVVKVVGLEAALFLFTDQPSAVNVLGGNTVRCLLQQSAQLSIGVIHVGGIIFPAQIADSDILCVISIRLLCMK